MTKSSVVFGASSSKLLPERIVKTNSTGLMESTRVSNERLNYIMDVSSPVQPIIDSKMSKLIDGLTIRTVNNRSLQGSGPYTIGLSSLPAGVEILSQPACLPASEWIESTGSKVYSSEFPDLANKYLNPTVSYTSSTSSSVTGSFHHLFCSPGGTFVAIAKNPDSSSITDVWYSTDDGLTWIKRVEPIPTPLGFTGWIKGFYFYSRLLLITNEYEILLSDDDGFSWFESQQNPKDLLTTGYEVNQVGNRLLAVQTSPTATGPAMSGSYLHYQVAVSYDGLSWEKDSRPYLGISHYEPKGRNRLGNDPISAVYSVFGSDRAAFIVGKSTSGAFWIAKSTDRLRWSHQDLNHIGYSVPASAISNFGYSDGCFYLSCQSPFRVFQSVDEGNTWSVSLNTTGSALKNVKSNGVHLLISTSATYSLENGQWTQRASIPPYLSTRCYAYNPISRVFLTTTRNEAGGPEWYSSSVARCVRSEVYQETFNLPDRRSLNNGRDYVMHVKIKDPT